MDLLRGRAIRGPSPLLKSEMVDSDSPDPAELLSAGSG